jgi:hypothetical protein
MVDLGEEENLFKWEVGLTIIVSLDFFLIEGVSKKRAIWVILRAPRVNEPPMAHVCRYIHGVRCPHFGKSTVLRRKGCQCSWTGVRIHHNSGKRIPAYQLQFVAMRPILHRPILHRWQSSDLRIRFTKEATSQ